MQRQRVRIRIIKTEPANRTDYPHGILTRLIMVYINPKSSRPRPPRSSILSSSSTKKLSLVVLLSGVAVVVLVVVLVVFVAYAGIDSSCAEGDASCAAASSASSSSPVFGRYPSWEDAPSSYEEFDHDNDGKVCRLPIISVEEWEVGRYWEREEPVIVRNVTDGWKALEHWTK